VIRLLSGFVGGPKLFLLLVQYFPTTVGPGCSLLASLARAITDVRLALFGSGTQRLPSFVARTWGIENASDGAKTEPRKKPKKTIAIVFRHK
jgi:hypothetical protein